MNREQGIKWVIRFFILINVYVFIADLLVILGRSKFQVITTPVILFPFFVYIAATLLIKNKYWILGCVFSELQSIAQIIASKYFEASNSFYNLSNLSIVAIIAGMICLLLSSFLFYKLLKISDIVSKKYSYKWMLALDNYIKQKFHTSKHV